MMLSIEYGESIERRFHAFCKAVLHNEACNYYREQKRKVQREISFEYLQENTSFAPHSTDEYFVLQDKPTAFEVNGQTVIVDSEKLAKALLCLSEGWREIILMRYYLQLRDKQIRALYFALLNKGFNMQDKDYYLIAETKEERDVLEKKIYEIVENPPDKHIFHLPENIQMPFKYNNFIPLELLRKQFVEGFIDLDGM